MRRALSYDSAVKLLGGDAARLVQVVDTLLGAGMLMLVGPFGGLLGWFDAKAELTRVTERMITGLVDKRSALSRFERTERLEAAHAVLALAAFFEVMSEARLPLTYADLELTGDEQKKIGQFKTGVRASFGVPGPAQSHEDFRAHLTTGYEVLAAHTLTFASGLAVFDRLPATGRAELETLVSGLPEPAVARFESMLGRLAAEFPEVRFWAGLREHSATHAALREANSSLATLREVLRSISTGRAPDARRQGLALAYQAALIRPIADAGEVPDGLQLPSLGAAFVPQAHRTTAGKARLSNEDWWEKQPVRDDLLAFLTGHLTSRAATEAPLLVLGQPGSGKSVLAKILAAQLPPSDFLPVLVALRAVHAAADLQEQIEQAIRVDTGERVEWPALARSAGDALPLVILDGFDELLQATGVSQTDYLMQVAKFQRREADQGRPVAVIVTSRTSVADRAQVPEGTTAVRLEPFDAARVAAWLTTWNGINAGHALELDTVMRYPDLAGQPLLLLMLAIYDAEGEGLRSAGTLRTDQLYERLLERFARREVDKRGTGLPRRERDRLVEIELRKLSVVAFAMFNRGTQWVTEAQLDADLSALPGLAGTRTATVTADMRTPLRDAEIALGSFFFVHRSRATRDDTALTAYEFLHATFGEFLVARLIHRTIHETVARERTTTFTTGPGVEDGLLHALLSFAPLAVRRQIVVFVQEMATDLSEDDRDDWVQLMIRLFDTAQQPRLPDAFDRYAPRRLTVAARIAAHTANLLLLLLCARDITAAQLLGFDDENDAKGRRTIAAWRETALLWHSQATTSGWSGLLDLVQLTRIGRPRERRDMTLHLHEEGAATALPIDARWVLGQDREAPSTPDGKSWVFYSPWADTVRRETYFTCDQPNDFQQHALDPLYRTGMYTIGEANYLPIGEPARNVLDVILGLAHDPDAWATERAPLYQLVADWSNQSFPGAGSQLLHFLEHDPDISDEVVVGILETIKGSAPDAAFVRCIAARLRPDIDEELIYLLAELLADVAQWHLPELDAAIRLAELGLEAIHISEDEARTLLREHGAVRPDLVNRIRILVEPYAPVAAE